MRYNVIDKNQIQELKETKLKTVNKGIVVPRYKDVHPSVRKLVNSWKL